MIEKLADLEIGLYKDALTAQSPSGKRAFFSFNDYLAERAQKGDIAPGLLSADKGEQVKRYGKELSPVRQMLHNSGVTFLGKHSSSCAAFFPKSGNSDYVKGAEVLFPALVQEVFESAIEGRPMAQGGFVTSPSDPDNLLYRQVTLGRVDDQLINALDNPNLLRLDDIVVMTTGIDSDSYRNMVITDTGTDAYEFGRVAEYGEIPMYTISTADRAIRVYKRGGGIKASYEVLRRQSINQLALVITRFGLARRLQLVRDALAVALNGDGNANSGANDTALANAPTIQDLDEYAIDVSYDYSQGLTHAVGDNTEVKNIRALRYPAADLQLTPTQIAMFGSFQTPGQQTLRVAPSGSVLEDTRKVLWWNRANGLEQVQENGSAVEEADRFVLTQSEVFTISFNTGFSKPMVDGFHSTTRAAS